MTLALNTNIIDAKISPAIFLKGDMVECHLCSYQKDNY